MLTERGSAGGGAETTVAATTTSCRVCGTSTGQRPWSETARVRCNVRAFANEHFTVWRCGQCRSLHCLEPIDFDVYYADYPIRRQKYDFFAKRIYARRLAFLREAGLADGQTLLDYGCGSGLFVRYARSQGIRAEGYEPYGESFGDERVLDRTYDFVTCQDVIEHDEDPNGLLERLKDRVSPGGALAIGTPDADRIDLRDPLAPLDALHMPYHRHIYAERELARLMSAGGWEIALRRCASYIDTPFPFVNFAFLVRMFETGGGVVDAGFDPMRPLHVLRHPTLLFWGVFGYWFPRGNNLIIVARAPRTAAAGRQ